MPTINTHKGLVQTVQEAYESAKGQESTEQIIVLADELATGRKLRIEIMIGTPISQLRVALRHYMLQRPHGEVYKDEIITVYHRGNLPKWSE